MMRKLDNVWFRLLGVLQRGVVRCEEARCRREKLRRFRCHLAGQRTHLN